MLESEETLLRTTALENIKSIAAARNRAEALLASKIEELAKSQENLKAALAESQAALAERILIAEQLKEERETLEILNRLSPNIATNLDLKSLVQIATDEATKATGAAFGAFFYNIITEDGKALLLYTLSGAPREAFSHFGMPRATAVFGPTFRGQGTIMSDDITADPRYGRNEPHFGMPKGHLPVKSYLAVPVISRGGEVIGGLFFGHPAPSIFAERDAQVAEGIAALAAIGIDNARLYDQVKQGQKRAEEANLAKSDFLATMSHEIRTPMNAIVGLSSILALTPLTEKQGQFVKTLQSSADSLLALINDLLDISKIEARSVELEEVPFSMVRLVEEVVSMTSVHAQEKGLTFTSECQALEKVILVGDRNRISQILINLCSNAIKFTEYGSISLKVTSEESEDLGVRNVLITVSDTGIGIASDYQKIIFEKFVQADTSISRKYGGSGLGLSITKRLVEAMGGTIEVKSELGLGATFIVSLPLKIAAEGSSVGNTEEVLFAGQGLPTQKNVNVLVVEDHEPNVLVASTFLEALNCKCEIARDGYAAIEAVKAHEFDMILMDVQMPGRNGLVATQMIRELEKKMGRARSFIVGVTAHAMAGDRERCFSAGMDDYMAKPYGMKDLQEKISTELVRKKLRHPS